MALVAVTDSFAILERAFQRARARAWARPRLKTLMHWVVAFWVFSGGFVLVEPSPYEFAFILVLPAVVLGGMKLYRSILPLLGIILFFLPFAMIAAFQPNFTPVSKALTFQFVTIFLMITSYIVGNYVAEDPQRRMRLIITAYTLIAVICAIVGTLAYLKIMPGHDLFTRYGRAKGFFKDPNVYGPFLVLPAMYALQRIMFLKGKASVVATAIYLALFVGVFASFSRAAWGHFLVSSAIVFVLGFALEARAREKARMLILVLVGVLMLAGTLAGLLSIPAVSSLFDQRAAVEQDYDSGATGRFGRQAYAFDLALNNPLGIGPAEFRNLRIVEEPHDSYVSTIHNYGWGGALAYYAIIIATLWRAFSVLFKRSPNRLLLIPLVAVYVPLIVEAAIIDIDHWRHYYLVVGLIWGVVAGYQRLRPDQERHLSGII